MPVHQRPPRPPPLAPMDANHGQEQQQGQEHQQQAYYYQHQPNTPAHPQSIPPPPGQQFAYPPHAAAAQHHSPHPHPHQQPPQPQPSSHPPYWPTSPFHRQDYPPQASPRDPHIAQHSPLPQGSSFVSQYPPQQAPYVGHQPPPIPTPHIPFPASYPPAHPHDQPPRSAGWHPVSYQGHSHVHPSYQYPPPPSPYAYPAEQHHPSYSTTPTFQVTSPHTPSHLASSPAGPGPYPHAFNSPQYPISPAGLPGSYPSAPVTPAYGSPPVPYSPSYYSQQGPGPSPASSFRDIDSDSSLANRQPRRRRRPPFSYSSLIAQAIIASPDKRLTLREVYTWIMEKYPQMYTADDNGWQNTIRHNLSLNKCFKKVPRSEINRLEGPGRGSRGKGGYWTIDPAHMLTFADGNFARGTVEKRRPGENNTIMSLSPLPNPQQAIGSSSSNSPSSPLTPDTPPRQDREKLGLAPSSNPYAAHQDRQTSVENKSSDVETMPVRDVYDLDSRRASGQVGSEEYWDVSDVDEDEEILQSGSDSGDDQGSASPNRRGRSSQNAPLASPSPSVIDAFANTSTQDRQDRQPLPPPLEMSSASYSLPPSYLSPSRFPTSPYFEASTSPTMSHHRHHPYRPYLSHASEPPAVRPVSGPRRRSKDDTDEPERIVTHAVPVKSIGQEAPSYLASTIHKNTNPSSSSTNRALSPGSSQSPKSKPSSHSPDGLGIVLGSAAAAKRTLEQTSESTDKDDTKMKIDSLLT